MKKVLIFATLTLVSTLMFGQMAFAQNAMREERKESRQDANQEAQQQMIQMLNSKQFMFSATEIQQTTNPNIQNIQLNQIWGIWLLPNQFKAYLPIYGTSFAYSQPTLLRRMDFTANSYDYNVQKGEAGGVNVTITVNDVWSNTIYTFLIMTTYNGQNSTMTVSTPYQPSVTFLGDIQPSSITPNN